MLCVIRILVAFVQTISSTVAAFDPALATATILTAATDTYALAGCTVSNAG